MDRYGAVLADVPFRTRHRRGTDEAHRRRVARSPCHACTHQYWYTV